MSDHGHSITSKGPVVVTFNLDAELFWLAIDPAATDCQKSLSIGEYGVVRGLPRILDILARHDVRATWFVPGLVAKRYPKAVGLIASEGHEVGSRSFDLTPLDRLSPEEKRESIQAGIDALGQLLPEPPVGFRPPPGELTTGDYELVLDIGISWVSSLHSGEVPRSVRLPSGRNLIDIPTRWELSDAAFFQFNYRPAYPAGANRIASYAAVLDEWRGDLGSTSMIGLPTTFTFHPQVIGKPGRAALLDRLLQHARELGLPFLTMGDLVTE